VRIVTQYLLIRNVFILYNNILSVSFTSFFTEAKYRCFCFVLFCLLKNSNFSWSFKMVFWNHKAFVLSYSCLRTASSAVVLARFMCKRLQKTSARMQFQLQTRFTLSLVLVLFCFLGDILIRAEDGTLISAVQLITGLLETAEILWPSYQCPVSTELPVLCFLFWPLKGCCRI